MTHNRKVAYTVLPIFLVVCIFVVFLHINAPQALSTTCEPIGTYRQVVQPNNPACIRIGATMIDSCGEVSANPMRIRPDLSPPTTYMEYAHRCVTLYEDGTTHTKNIWSTNEHE